MTRWLSCKFSVKYLSSYQKASLWSSSKAFMKISFEIFLQNMAYFDSAWLFFKKYSTSIFLSYIKKIFQYLLNVDKRINVPRRKILLITTSRTTYWETSCWCVQSFLWHSDVNDCFSIKRPRWEPAQHKRGVLGASWVSVAELLHALHVLQILEVQIIDNFHYLTKVGNYLWHTAEKLHIWLELSLFILVCFTKCVIALGRAGVEKNIAASFRIQLMCAEISSTDTHTQLCVALIFGINCIHNVLKILEKAREIAEWKASPTALFGNYSEEKRESGVWRFQPTRR